MTNSVYLHIPFCANICTYCNFSKFFYNEKVVWEYLNSLEMEIKTRYRGEVIKTLYIGGGTPSSLNIRQLEKLFSLINIFKLDSKCEFTIEVNPENITLEKLELFKKNKVNRISIGIQSTISKNLKYLGRNHDYKLIKEKIALIKQYINNINVDLIYALKGESLKDLEKDLNNILKLEVNHISTYSLIIEEHTILKIRNQKNICEELDYQMYVLICKKLKENGYIHYEISNFAKPGYESKHNLVYWNNDYYYGFGLAACSYLKNQRLTNTKTLKEYLQGNYLKEIENLREKDILSYALILGFRKIAGINEKEFFLKYNVNLKDLYNIKELLKKKLLKTKDGNIFISYDKIYVENSILINFVGE